MINQRYAVSISEACDLVGVKKTSLYKLLAQNELKSVRILSRQFVTLESIRALTGESV